MKRESGKWVWLSRRMFDWRHGEESPDLLHRLWYREVERIERNLVVPSARAGELTRYWEGEGAYIFYLRDGAYKPGLAIDDVLFWAAFGEGSDTFSRCLEVLMVGSKPRTMHDADAASMLDFVHRCYPVLTDLRFMTLTVSRVRRFKRVMADRGWVLWWDWLDGTQHWVRSVGQA